MRIGDDVYVHGTVDEIRKDVVIIRNNGGYFGTTPDEIIEQVNVEPEQHWIPVSERLPERIINDNVETVQVFFVTVKERWPGEEWSYNTDIAEFPGDYIDDIWQTYNDWREGQEVHVIAWQPLPEPYEEGNNE